MKDKKIFDNLNLSLDSGDSPFNESSWESQPREVHESVNPKFQSEVEGEVRHVSQTTQDSADTDAMYQKLIQKKWSLLDRWRDRDMYDHVQVVREELFQMAAKNRLSLYDLLLQSRLQYTKEMYETKLKCIKAHNRRHSAAFVMAQLEELSREVKGYQYRFIEMMKSKYRYANTLKEYPSLAHKYRASMIREEERYLTFLDRLITKFESVASEELEIYRSSN